MRSPSRLLPIPSVLNRCGSGAGRPVADQQPEQDRVALQRLVLFPKQQAAPRHGRGVRSLGAAPRLEIGHGAHQGVCWHHGRVRSRRRATLELGAGRARVCVGTAMSQRPVVSYSWSRGLEARGNTYGLVIGGDRHDRLVHAPGRGGSTAGARRRVTWCRAVQGGHRR